jgi:hypothetical protein
MSKLRSFDWMRRGSRGLNAAAAQAHRSEKEGSNFLMMADRTAAHVGYFAKGRPTALFLDSDKPNSAINALASLLLQCGATAVAIGHALWRTPDGTPASLIGAAVRQLVALDLIDAGCGISLPAPGRRGR